MQVRLWGRRLTQARLLVHGGIPPRRYKRQGDTNITAGFLYALARRRVGGRVGVGRAVTSRGGARYHEEARGSCLFVLCVLQVCVRVFCVGVGVYVCVGGWVGVCFHPVCCCSGHQPAHLSVQPVGTPFGNTSLCTPFRNTSLYTSR